ncbi:hypothetical protein RhiirA5_435361 [Rhizophagus irregularis]|uniref:Uncharacterized protein n=1 Tax=Rhizophagus irregularis TaxID=588596 RepID=A0A2N0NNJ8_9GLOM|nr:hypothetical protein RhiirA5_435361 [Rhizophagus irregularis]
MLLLPFDASHRDESNDIWLNFPVSDRFPGLAQTGQSFKLEQKNKELEARLAIVEQAFLPVEEQSYNDNPSDDSTSNFNLVAEYHEKPLVDVETDNSFPEEVFYNKQELITEVVTIPVNSVKHLNGKLLKEKDMDSFLLEAHKKIVSSEIKQRNKEKKLQVQESLSTHPKEKVLQELNLCNRSHKKKGIDELKHKLFNPSSETDSPSSINYNIMTEVSKMAHPEKFTCDSIDEASYHLAQLCDKAIDTEDRANRAN